MPEQRVPSRCWRLSTVVDCDVVATSVAAAALLLLSDGDDVTVAGAGGGFCLLSFDSNMSRSSLTLMSSVEPPLLLAQILIWTYVGARAAHFVAYMTAQLHDIRATFWTFSSLPVLVMAGYVLVQVI